MNFKNIAAVYFTKNELLPELCTELGEVLGIIENAVFSSVIKTCSFALDAWYSPKLLNFNSISEAAYHLRQQGGLWYLHPLNCVRRSKLIEQQVKKCPVTSRHFPLNELPVCGGFSLLDTNHMIYSQNRMNPWPSGICRLIEDKVNPPNRAYLKLWEALSLLKKGPDAGDSVLDLGASPGGWTYVMQSLGAKVTAVDKAPLDRRIAQLPGVEFLQQSAFSLDPRQLQDNYDWLLSDIACYPERAYRLIQQWIDSGRARQLIFTIKLQGKTDLQVIKQFQNIENASLRHLFHNKHELTFFYPALPEGWIKAFAIG